ERDREREDEVRLVANQLLLVGDPGPVVAHARRQARAGDALHDAQGLARAEARRGIPDDAGGGIEVVPREELGPEHASDADEGAEWHHLSRAVGDEEARDVLQLAAGGRRTA